ncbi:hypothetical protein Tco_0250256 [Tanacetum coccineum]
MSSAKSLSDSDRHLLDSMVSLEEIKNAVWDCGSQKAPGPDGFSFMFVKKYWDIMKIDIQNFVMRLENKYPLSQIYLEWGFLPDNHRVYASMYWYALSASWKANVLSSRCRFNSLIKSECVRKPWYLSTSHLMFCLKLFLRPLEKVFRASFFWGATGDSRKLAWIKWSNILASLDKGGLGVGSLKAFNNSLLLKWRWRLLNKPPALWVEVQKSIHGNEAGIELKGC